MSKMGLLHDRRNPHGITKTTTESGFIHQIHMDCRRSSTETGQTATEKPQPDGDTRIIFSVRSVTKRGKTDSILRIFQI